MSHTVLVLVCTREPISHKVLVTRTLLVHVAWYLNASVICMLSFKAISCSYITKSCATDALKKKYQDGKHWRV